MNYLNIGVVDELTEEEQSNLNDLVTVFNYHIIKNHEKLKYYEGHVPLREVNLGIALPKSFGALEIGCEWGAKCVDVLASRSMFDGFVASNGSESEEVNRIMKNNHILSEYQKFTRDQLKFGCTFATLSADTKIGCRIRFHSPLTASALWDGEKGRISCGMAIIDSVRDEKENKFWTPSLINYYTENAVIVLQKDGKGKWHADRHSHSMGQPLMIPLIWNSTSQKPFGRSRIKESIRRLIQGYIRTVANATIGLEFSTTPQKYIMGVTDEQYDALVSDKFRSYVGSIIVSTSNPETGEKPNIGQMSQGSITPHVEMMRMLATQFSAASGLSVTDTGVVNDANPTSSDAILAQSQTLVLMAEQLNSSNANALALIAKMALAISKNSTIEELTEEEADVVAHFKNPAMPSVSMTADAAIKIAAAREGFSETDVFLEMIGFSQADIRRIKAQERRARGSALLAVEVTEDEDIG